MAAKVIEPRTNGDRVDRAVHELTAQIREHPDEVVVGALPIVVALHLSIKYDMKFADHMVITQAGWYAGLALARAYREWKTRPARPSLLKEVI